MRVSSLDRATREQAFAVFNAAYEGADRWRFEHDLDEKQLVILLHDDRTNQLRGFSTILLREEQCDGRAATVVFSGDTVIDKRYWGQKALQREFSNLLLTLKLAAPWRPLYWFLISKGYRTYMLLANAFPVAVPRHNRVEDRHLTPLMNQLATERFGSQYDPESGIVRYSVAHERVRDGIAPVNEEVLRNVHARFYVSRNPGHVEGHELACLARVRLLDLARVSLRILRARVMRRFAP